MRRKVARSTSSSSAWAETRACLKGKPWACRHCTVTARFAARCNFCSARFAEVAELYLLCRHTCNEDTQNISLWFSVQQRILHHNGISPFWWILQPSRLGASLSRDAQSRACCKSTPLHLHTVYISTQACKMLLGFTCANITVCVQDRMPCNPY